ncbi:MAG: class I SAM-dependent methyltransferase [Rubrivivax sp.]|nr:class I SAM-dependent methyltransferase [Rubrivivax sp.]
MKRDDLPHGHSRASSPPSAAAPQAGDAAWLALHARACAPYGAAGRFARHFARGKLGRDPVFRSLVERGELGCGARVVDIGCGQGLLASLLQACDDLAGAGRWPLAWPAPPRAERYHGIELMPRDVERARRAVAGLALAPTFECNDMREAVLPACELVVILDVLHYVDHAAQSALLVRVRDALLQGRADRPRRLLLRVGDASSRRGFVASQWVDRAVALVRGHRVPPTWGRPLDDWVALLRELGFSVASAPMSRGTPFANVLLLADVAGTA